MTAVHFLIGIWILAPVMMTCGWLWQRRRNKAGIVDVLWAIGLVVSAVLAALSGNGAAAPRALLGVCGGLWGLRLAVRLWRRMRAEPEDGRYRALRWGEGQAHWFGLFQFRAWMIAFFSVPFVIAATNPATQPVWLAMTAAIWIASVVVKTSPTSSWRASAPILRTAAAFARAGYGATRAT